MTDEELDVVEGYVSPGKYDLVKPIRGFKKERGEICTTSALCHMEIISVTNEVGEHLPILLKIWDINTGRGREYLFSDNLINFRCEYLNADIPTDAVVLGIAACLMDIGDQFVPVNSVNAIGMGTIPFLIPNMDQNEYNNHFSVIDSYHDVNEAMDYVLAALYGKHMGPNDIVGLVGILDRKIPRVSTRPYVPIPRTIKHDGSSMILYDSDHYFALLMLSRIPFDYFVVTVNVSGNWVNIHQLDSMAGLHLPMTCDRLLGYISEVCKEFVYCFLDVGCESFQHNFGKNQELIKVVLIKTMDEYIRIKVHTEIGVTEYVFDLLMLSVMSPVISA